MEYNNIFEEKKARVDDYEIPIECLIRYNVRNDSNTKSVKPGLHRHEYAEIAYGLDCDVSIICDEEAHTLRSGELILISPQKPHTFISNQRLSTYVVIKFMPQILYAAEQSVWEFKYTLPLLASKPPYNMTVGGDAIKESEIPEIISAVVSEWEHKGYGYELALRMHVIHIVLWLLRHWHSGKDDLLNNTSREAMASIQKAIEYAQNNYSNASSCEAAELCCMSTSYFSRVFKKVMGKNFTDYVNYLRVCEAQRLLVSTSKSITEIALDVGFSTTSYFIERFKKQLNMTPNHFRTLHNVSKG